MVPFADIDRRVCVSKLRAGIDESRILLKAALQKIGNGHDVKNHHAFTANRQDREDLGHQGLHAFAERTRSSK
jgi:hypothetical protein